MPNPKTQTVTFDLKNALAELSKGRVEFRSDKTGVIHLAIGKVSMDPAKVSENAFAIVKEIIRKKPTGAKGDFVQSIALSSTMGPGVHVDVKEATAATV
jgi:large subunit ribosomal protein L1